MIEAYPAVDDLLLNRSGDGVYRDKARMHHMLRKLLALPLLPLNISSWLSLPYPRPVFLMQLLLTNSTVVVRQCDMAGAQYDQQTCLYTASTYAPTTTWNERQIWPDIKKTSSPFGGRWVI